LSLNLVVVTPHGEVFAGPVQTVVLPGSEGDFGVLESHERFLAPLRAGPVEILLENGETEWAGVSAGFAEVSGDQVVVLVDECYKAHEIDREAALLTQEEAQASLDALTAEEHEEETRARLEESLVRAAVQVEVLAKHQG
jgi:F-type H+-transporting ATPase subunit epsilon